MDGSRRVLVTGADGFIGSHLVEALVRQGAAVRAFVFYNSFSSWGWLDKIDRSVLKEIEVFQGDIRDPNGVRRAVTDREMIFHLAALIGIPYSYHSPDSYVDTNIKGTLNILQAARDLDVSRILVTSTSEVYGTARYVPIDEDHPLQGQSPYSATKIAADALAMSFYRSFELPVTIVRPFNTYGPRQSARAFIPTIITQLLAGADTIRVGSLTTTRDLNFVQDTVSGFLAIAAAESTAGETVNIASQTEVSMATVAQMLIARLNPRARITEEEARIRPAKSEVQRLVGKNTKIRELTGWSPRYDLQKGLEETIEWFRLGDHMSMYKPGTYAV